MKKYLLKYIFRHKYIINHTGTIRSIASVVTKYFPKDSPIENSLLVTYVKIKKLFSSLVYFCVSALSFKYVFICFIILTNWSTFDSSLRMKSFSHDILALKSPHSKIFPSLLQCVISFSLILVQFSHFSTRVRRNR